MGMVPGCAVARSKIRARLLRSLLVLALLAGPACSAADALFGAYEAYEAYPSAANVIPAPTPATSGWASMVVLLTSARLGYAYHLGFPPNGTIDSIALYQVAAGDPLPASASAMLCAGEAACAATGGYATAVPPATLLTIQTALRANGMQAVLFTTTAQHAAGGAMRGTIQPIP
jgi:hypothetical protein